jgi:hypothetical protein
MAKAKSSSTTSTKRVRKKVSRPGVHAKTRHSNHKGSKFYKKRNRGQG